MGSGLRGAVSAFAPTSPSRPPIGWNSSPDTRRSRRTRRRPTTAARATAPSPHGRGTGGVWSGRAAGASVRSPPLVDQWFHKWVIMSSAVV